MILLEVLLVLCVKFNDVNNDLLFVCVYIINCLFFFGVVGVFIKICEVGNLIILFVKIKRYFGV